VTLLRAVLGKVLSLAVTLLAIAVLSFALLRAAPGGPFDDDKVPAAVRAEMEARYGLHDPVLVQLGRYLAGVAQGDLGPSFRYRGRSVAEVLLAGAPASAAIGLLALELAAVLGILGGALAAARKDGPADRVVRGVASLLGAAPSFLVAALLASVLGLTLRLFPVAGWGTWRHLVLPSVALALPHAAAIARLTRSSLLETLSQDFCRTARAKGVPEAAIVLRHALPPALAPVVQYLGPAAAGLVTGSLAVEAVFQVPGMGAHFVNAAQDRDYMLVMGTVLVYSAVLLPLNAAADLVAARLDPRSREVHGA